LNTTGNAAGDQPIGSGSWSGQELLGAVLESIARLIERGPGVFAQIGQASARTWSAAAAYSGPALL